MDKTPTTQTGMVLYDNLPPVSAVYRAWTEPGRHPQHHERMKAKVRETMPILARALDRMSQGKEL